jgi:hypothetical protein
MIERAASSAAGNGGNPRWDGGKFHASGGSIRVSFNKETRMTYPLFPPRAGVPRDPVARLDAQIAEARLEMTAVDAEIAAITAEIAAIEPHPHAHGYTYGGLEPAHFLPLAGLLAQPWAEALAGVEASRREQAFDYLLKAFPAVFATAGDSLVDDGACLIDARADRVEDDLTALFARKPMLATGMVWRLFGFHRRDRDAWIGAFAYGAGLSTLIAATEGVTDATVFGDALAAVVAASSA